MFDDFPLKPEPFRRDSYWHYTGFSESRVMIDPTWIEFGNPAETFTRLGLIVLYARKVSTPTKIEMLFPTFLKPPQARKWEGAYLRGPFYREVAAPKESRASDYNEALELGRAKFGELGAAYAKDPGAKRSDEEVDRLRYGGLLFGRPNGLQLLDLVLEHQCDYLLTENPWLHDASEALKKAGIWVARPLDLLELLQLSLRASGVFVEVVNPFVDEDWGELGRLKVGAEGHGFSSFYPGESRVLLAYMTWLDKVRGAKGAPDRVFNHGRAAFYHRYPFMQFAHDQVRYHSLYAQRFVSGNRYRDDHRFFVAYHLNVYYVMLAAMLDNVAWIWNYALGLGFKEHDKSRNRCTLTHKDFRKRLKASRPDFLSILEDEGVATWMTNLTLKRHPAVHREPLFLTQIIEQDTGKVISDSASIVADADKTFVFDLLGAADSDLKQLNAFLRRMIELPIPVNPSAI